MSVLNENQLLGASGAGGYDIPNSLRLNDDDSAYLSRTPASTGNRKTWTFSVWFKGAHYANSGAMLSTSQNYDQLRYQDTGEILLYLGNGVANLSTTMLFRDPSAWYHLTVAVDTTQATASDRVNMYVNGEQVTSFVSNTYPTLNYDTGFNFTGYTNAIGRREFASAQYLDGYLSEVNFIDGLALTPDSFGETGDYGEWKPIAYAGTYGTNGFNLKFENASSLGNDSAGSNNWTPNNLAATDQMLDSPTNNFATLNPLALGADGTLSEGSLKIVYGTSSTRASTTATIGTASDKRYWEVTMVTNGAEVIGISDSPTPLGLYTGQVAGGWGYYGDDGSKYVEGTNSAYGASYTTGDIIGFALDMDAGTLVCYKNNATQGTLASGLTGDMYPSIGDGGGTSTTSNVFNFGQDSSFAGNKAAQGNQDANGIGDFYYAPPTGFLALCTANLPEPDVIPSENFNTVLYTGNGSTQSITGVGFGSAPDLVWAKQRNGANPHEIADIVRGVNNTMGSSGTGADYNNTTYQYNSFDTDGFTVTDDAAGNYAINGSGKTYVAWNWKAGGSASSNSNGTITSSVSANPSAGFSIVSYTGTGSNATVGHGLTLAAPEMVIVKSRDTANSWNTWHEALPATNYVVLNSTQAAQAYAPLWNSTAPTSSVFSLGTDQGGNKSSDAFIAYAFHSVDGYSKVGSYTGNGSADGPFVHCGFKVAMIIQKRTDGADSWHILDNKRSPSNVVDDRLYPNSSSAESTSGDRVDFTSNGFKVRTTNGDFNASGGTYIFIAFAESPFKHSNAR